MREIGGYLLERPLGTGGVGSVFRGIPRGGGTPVALKIVPGELVNDHVRMSFEREALVAQTIRHPNLAANLGFGSTDDGGLYLVMELLEGEDLDMRLGRGTLDPAETVRIGSDAAAGLAAAHAAGILHRDVKPSNVFLCKDGTVKVVDFGLAVRVQELTTARLEGQPPIVVGTPGYMAVEQARGQHDADVRTDVWGLGATLYDALVGRPPFDAPTAMAQLVRMVSEEPDPFPTGVPDWLGRVVMRALRKDKAERWPTMQAFGEALRRGLERARVRDSQARIPVVARRDLAHIALGDEVRIVSVLLAESLADDAQFACFAAVVEREGGTASPLLGGRGVGLFGGEAWRGDEAERAVGAALAFRAEAPRAQLGVATGRGVRTRPGEVTGAVVARAQAVLSLDGTGADEETLRRIRGGFDTDGGSVLRRRAGAPVVGVEGPGGADLPLIGRTAQLDDLAGALDRVAAGVGAEGVVITGAAGIGKSRLLHALLADVATRNDRPTVLLGRGDASRVLQGWNVIEGALRVFAELPAGTEPEVTRERLEALCPTRRCAEFIGEILGAGFPETRHLRTARADPNVMRDQVMIAIGDWIEALTAERTVLLVFEDLQACDRLSQDLLAVVLRRLSGCKLLVVTTARPETVHSAALRPLLLGNLDPAATEELVGAVLGDPALAAIHQQTIAERSAGHPFFAQELALAVRAAADPSGPVELPASIEAAIQVRLDGLDRPERDLLRRASVFGRRFWEEGLLSMGEAQARALLGRLRMHDLVIRSQRSLLGGMTEWRFAHALVHEVAYASLTDEQRKHLHGAAARWLGRRGDANAAEVARHFDLAGEPEPAARSWLAAAEAAMREGDATMALEASGRALSRREVERPIAFSLRMLRVDLFTFLGHKTEAEGEIEELGKLAEQPGEHGLVHERWARHLRLRGRYFQAASVVRAGLQYAPDNPWLLIQEALLKADAGHSESAREAAMAAVGAAVDSGDPLAIGRAQAALAHCHSILGDVGAALPLEQRALAAYEEAGDPRRVATAHGNLAYYQLALGRADEAVRGLERAVELSRTAGNRSAEGYALHNLGLARARSGAVAEGIADETAALQIAREVEEPRLEIACRQYLAVILLEADRAGEALEVLEEALRTPEDVQGNLAPQLRGLYASALVAQGRTEEARLAARQAFDLREAAGSMAEFEAELFVAAHEAGIPFALAAGVQALEDRASRISDEEARSSFLERVPSHVRLLWLANS